jgi:hypothetical protein
MALVGCQQDALGTARMGGGDGCFQLGNKNGAGKISGMGAARLAVFSLHAKVGIR